MINKRKSGWYWVMIDDVWEVARWHSAIGEWSNDRLCRTVPDSTLQMIDERRIERGEHKDLHRPAMEIIREKVQVEQQRDELLAALYTIERNLSELARNGDLSMLGDETLCFTQDAIDKAKAAQAGE